MIIKGTVFTDVKESNEERLANYLRDGWKTEIIGRWDNNNNYVELKLQKDCSIEFKGNYKEEELVKIGTLLMGDLLYSLGFEVFNFSVHQNKEKIFSGDEFSDRTSWDELKKIVAVADWKDVNNFIVNNS